MLVGDLLEQTSILGSFCFCFLMLAVPGGRPDMQRHKTELLARLEKKHKAYKIN
jgi:hypothetical protein